MCVCVTINNECSRAAASFGHHVTSHTGVVCCVREPGLFDDQVVIDGDQKVGVLRWIYDVLVLQPVHLRKRQTSTMMKLSGGQDFSQTLWKGPMSDLCAKVIQNNGL